MYVTYMTKAYHNFLRSYEAKHPAGTGRSFLENIEEKLDSKAKSVEGPAGSIISTQDMTMEEYKKYIYDRISLIPIHPSQSCWNWKIDITESGFEAMKNDPSYGERVLNIIRANFLAVDQFHSETYSILHFGATEKEFRGTTLTAGNPAMREDEDSFWERRAKRQEKLEEQYEELQEKKAIAKRFWEEQGKVPPVFINMLPLFAEDTAPEAEQ